jgi:hypothetical protein
LAVASANGQGSGSGQPLFHDSGSVVFNFVSVGSTSEAKSVTIGNAGEGSLAIVKVGVSAGKDFSLSSDACTGKALSAGQTCTVSVVFHPSAAGTRLGSLVIEDARGECKNYVALAGSGTETQAPALANVADCAVPGQTVTLPGQEAPGKVPAGQSSAPQSEADVLQIVSPPRCIANRRFRMRLRTSKAERIVLARVYVNGHPRKTAHGHSLGVVAVDLHSRSLRRYRLQIVVSTATGHMLGLTRYFTSCGAGASVRH